MLNEYIRYLMEQIHIKFLLHVVSVVAALAAATWFISQLNLPTMAPTSSRCEKNSIVESSHCSQADFEP
jgi:hypothetical protein